MIEWAEPVAFAVRSSGSAHLLHKVRDPQIDNHFHLNHRGYWFDYFTSSIMPNPNSINEAS